MSRLRWGSLGARASGTALAIIGIGCALALWQGASVVAGSAAFPSPVDVFSNLRDNLFSSLYLEQHRFASGGYIPHLIYTVRNVILGVSTGAAIGIFLGLASVLRPVIADIVTPIAGTFGAAPIIVAAPFFLIWFGIVATAQVLLVTFYTILLLYIYSRRAVENIPPEYVESALTLGAKQRDVFRAVYVPGTIPQITAGIRIALASSWGLEAVTELLGSQEGIGVLMTFFRGGFIIPGMLALVVVLGIVAVFCDWLVVRASNYLTRWSETGHRLAL